LCLLDGYLTIFTIVTLPLLRNEHFHWQLQWRLPLPKTLSYCWHVASHEATLTRISDRVHTVHWASPRPHPPILEGICGPSARLGPMAGDLPHRALQRDDSSAPMSLSSFDTSQLARETRIRPARDRFGRHPSAALCHTTLRHRRRHFRFTLGVHSQVCCG
jgi:hypothetical protein